MCKFIGIVTVPKLGWVVAQIHEDPRIVLRYRRRSVILRADKGGFHHSINSSNELDDGLGGDDADLLEGEVAHWIAKNQNDLKSLRGKGVNIQVLLLSDASSRAVPFAEDALSPSCAAPDVTRPCSLVVIPFPGLRITMRRWRQVLRRDLTHEMEHALQHAFFGGALPRRVRLLAEMGALVAEWQPGGDIRGRGFDDFMSTYRSLFHFGLAMNDSVRAGYLFGPFMLALEKRCPGVARRVWSERRFAGWLKQDLPLRALNEVLGGGSSLFDAFEEFCAGLMLQPHGLPPVARIQRHFDGLAVQPLLDVSLAALRVSIVKVPLIFLVRKSFSCTWFRVLCEPGESAELKWEAQLGLKVLVAHGRSVGVAASVNESIPLYGETWIAVIAPGDLDFGGGLLSSPKLELEGSFKMLSLT